jgi:subtilisin family serine protease
MVPLELARLTNLMQRTSGRPDVTIGLIDGPVATQHPDLAGGRLREIHGRDGATCTQRDSAACVHGTFVAGILSARRQSSAPGICPDCTVLVRPIFTETPGGAERVPSATPHVLATAIIECIDAGARVINLSVALSHPSSSGNPYLEEALNRAVQRRVLVVAAAGNQGTLASSAITRYPWVIPVVACDLRGRPMNQSNVGSSIGKRGLMAPGDAITSLSPDGQPLTFGGTSVAVPFVTGTIALLWSEFPAATSEQIRFAVSQTSTWRRASVVPPLLDAEIAYQSLSTRSRHD